MGILVGIAVFPLNHKMVRFGHRWLFSATRRFDGLTQSQSIELLTGGNLIALIGVGTSGGQP